MGGRASITEGGMTGRRRSSLGLERDRVVEHGT